MTGVLFAAGVCVGGLIVCALWQRDLRLVIRYMQADAQDAEARARAAGLARRVESMFRAHEQSGELMIGIEAASDREAIERITEWRRG